MIKQMGNPILEYLILKLRDPATDRKEFRETLEDVGRHIGMVIARDLAVVPRKVTTVMGAEATHHVVSEDPLIISILRAGIPLGYGIHKVFPYAEVGFIGAMRNEESETSEASISYTTTPEDIHNKVVILADTMIATGGSILKTIKVVEKYQPSKLILAGAIAARPGLDNILCYDPDIDIYPGAIDPILDSNNYIVPGLGDAGDRCYGGKMEKFLKTS